MRKKCIPILLAVILLSFCSLTQAAKLDAYREMMKNRSFTLKYEIEIPDNYLDGVEMFIKDGKSYPIWKLEIGDNIEKTERFMPPYNGVVVINASDEYAEVLRKGGTFAYQFAGRTNFSQKTIEKTNVLDMGDGGSYYLNKNGEKFYYVSYHAIGWMFGSGGKKYVAMVGKERKEGKIEAGTYYPNPQEAMRCEYNYGHPIIGQILHAIYTDGNLPTEYASPTYGLTDNGQLDDGLFYEDYTAEQGGMFYALRFYFDGDTMVKVSSVSYKQTADGKMDAASYQTKTVHIKEFSSTPDVSYLSLPEGLKDVTKREKAKAGEDE